MPSYRELYPKEWLSADDLQGRTVPITIQKVEVLEVHNRLTNKKEPRLTARFLQRPAIKMSINKTNAEALERITGTDDYTRWQGVSVRLRPDRAPNGKPTILILPPGGAQQNPVHGQQNPVHGQDELVHGQPPPVHGQPPPVHGPDEDVDFSRPPAAEGEEVSTPVDPKSGGGDPRGGHEAGDAAPLLPAEIVVDTIRQKHAQSDGPMTDEQWVYLTSRLSSFSGGNGQMLFERLLGRAVHPGSLPGEQAGRYLYDVLRDDSKLTQERAALLLFCGRELTKPMSA